MLALLHDQQIAVQILADHKPALARAVGAPADAQPAPLAERIIHQPVMPADNFARFIDRVARLGGQILH